jgi:hypothetical protein
LLTLEWASALMSAALRIALTSASLLINLNRSTLVAALLTSRFCNAAMISSDSSTCLPEPADERYCRKVLDGLRARVRENVETECEGKSM